MSAGSPEPWSRTVAQHRDNQIEQIGRAAFELVGTHGLAQVTMSDIARSLGISRPTLYKYVDSVESALRVYIERQSMRFHDRLVEAVGSAADPAARLDRFIATTLEHAGATEHAGLVAQLGSGGLSPAVESAARVHVEKSHDLLVDILVEGRNAGLVRRDLDLGMCARLIQQMLAVANLVPLGPSLAAEEVVATVRALIWHGMAVGPA